MSEKKTKLIQLTKEDAGMFRARQSIVEEKEHEISKASLILSMLKTDATIYLSSLFRKYSVEVSKDFEYSITEKDQIEIREVPKGEETKRVPITVIGGEEKQEREAMLSAPENNPATDKVSP